ncbi:MAG: hypothetical protein AAF226_17990 [Verrucomicrobiota bacterium]
MADKLLYTITTGRSGTVFLAKLFELNVPDCTVHHERFGFRDFGVHCPDLSTMMTFNHMGFTKEVSEFWRKKIQNDIVDPNPNFAEISHVLAKGGLIESLGLFPDVEFHIVAQTRDPFKIYWSYLNRFDFANNGFTWLFTLDHGYRNVIIDPKPFISEQMFGVALWYVWEVFARMEYYQHFTANLSNVKFYRTDLSEMIKPENAHQLLTSFIDKPINEMELPGKENARAHDFFGEKEKKHAEKIFQRFQLDPFALGREYFESGKELGRPLHLFTSKKVALKQNN